jgi:hypothetical protein
VCHVSVKGLKGSCDEVGEATRRSRCSHNSSAHQSYVQVPIVELAAHSPIQRNGPGLEI